MQKPETKFRKKFRKYLDEIPNSWFESIQQKTINGTPDILGCINGIFVALELKSSAKAPITPLQAFKIEAINAAGGCSAIVHPGNFKDVLEALRKINKLQEGAKC